MRRRHLVRLLVAPLLAAGVFVALATTAGTQPPPPKVLPNVGSVVEGDAPSRQAETAEQLALALSRAEPGTAVRGPSRLHRLRGRTRRAILLQAPLSSTLTAATRRVLDMPQGPASRSGVRIGIDVDPQDT